MWPHMFALWADEALLKFWMWIGSLIGSTQQSYQLKLTKSWLMISTMMTVLCKWLSPYMYEVDLVWVWSGWENPIITYQYDTCQKSTLSRLQCRSKPALREITCGVRTQSYNCPPLIKYTKHLLYVWSGSSMSISGWEIPIMSYSMSPVRNPLKILQPSSPF